MNKPPNLKLIVTGAVLLLCLPAFALTGGLLSYYLPRQYYSKTALEIHSNQADFSRAFQVAAAPYLEAVTMRQVQPDLIEIGVWDTDAQRAADRANSIATKIQRVLASAPPAEGATSVDSGARIEAMLRPPAVKVMERAEPALEPGRPRVGLIMLFVAGGGAILTVLGVILMIIGFVSGRDFGSASPRAA